MTKSDLKKLGFKTNFGGFLSIRLKHDLCLLEGDKNGYLDVFELNHSDLRFDNIEDVKLFIKLVNK